MRVFQFDSTYGEGSGKCGSCNWEIDKIYVRAKNKKEAEKLLAEYQEDDGNGLCGDCFSEMLTKDSEITLIKK